MRPSTAAQIRTFRARPGMVAVEQRALSRWTFVETVDAASGVYFHIGDAGRAADARICSERWKR